MSEQTHPHPATVEALEIDNADGHTVHRLIGDALTDGVEAPEDIVEFIDAKVGVSGQEHAGLIEQVDDYLGWARLGVHAKRVAS